MDNGESSNETSQSHREEPSRRGENPQRPLAEDFSQVMFALDVADQIDSLRDLRSLAIVSRAHYEGIMRSHGRDLHLDFRGFDSPDEDAAYCSAPKCNTCHLAKRIARADDYVAWRNKRVGDNVRSLKLTGSFAWDDRPTSGFWTPEHEFLRHDGLKSLLSLEEFRFQVDWRFWNFSLLTTICPSNLKVLEVPVRSGRDCIELGKTLPGFNCLESITITDIPDNDEFTEALPHLGRGLLARASSLKHLDISLVNFNRDCLGDAPFIIPFENDHHFRALFQGPPKKQADRAVENFLAGTEDLWGRKPSFRLRSLRLKHFGIPRDAFKLLFSTETVQKLSLPHCRVDPEVWADLNGRSNLLELTDIDYNLLCTSFLRCVKSQTKLQKLIFSRPQDVFEDMGIEEQDDMRWMYIKPVEKLPQLGPGTKWFQQNCDSVPGRFPKLTDVTVALLGKDHLRHLRIPADLFDITDDFLLQLSVGTRGIESLAIGFDYNDSALRETFTRNFLPNLPKLRRITFLSLPRPEPLHHFNSQTMRPFIEALGRSAPSALKHVCYEELAVEDYPGSWWTPLTEYYYHKTEIGKEEWLKLDGNDCEKMFEEGRTPQLMPYPGEVDEETPFTDEVAEEESIDTRGHGGLMWTWFKAQNFLDFSVEL